ncbi:hypothetical protein MAHJHV57_50540 [Mycobacterium avium subsp. hominissuis]
MFLGPCACSTDTPAAASCAASLNRAVSGAAAQLAAAGVSVLHAHGPKNTLDLREPQPGDPPYVAVPYLDRMDLAYAAADTSATVIAPDRQITRSAAA